ncbi:hypothetical protein QR680_005936 [Steinernema hermaphroditum]|uniref:SSD domain-containing protein n=1 Tax=Steinernema hermaphroditum TaxID=289476 RepID=A0AA39LW90_9BILA|nr:hypothetical protein QR680_005936 [Steinernema hermaphroditum]
MKSLGFHISRAVQRFYHSLGRVVFRHSIAFFAIPILLTVISAVGLLRFNEENRIWYLYSPSTAPSHFEHAVANEFFRDRGGKFWLEVAITAHDTGNLLREHYLEEVEGISNYLNYNFTVPCSLTNTGQCSFSQLCTGPCNDNQIIPIFRMIYRNITQRLHPNFRLTYPTIHLYNDDYYVGEHFSGVDVDSRQRMESIRVVVLYFRTDKQNGAVAETLDTWERQVLDFVNHFDNKLVNVTLSSDGIVSHEVRRNGMSCVPYFSLTVVFVFCFIFSTSRDRNDPDFTVVDMFFVALFGTMGPLMAVGTTFGLMLLIGLPFNSITLVMPFLVIGVGCDDVFIILHAWRKTNKEDSLETRIAETMEEGGPSITLTSLTNGLSFAVGALATTPAIRLFCIYTAVGVLIDFIYQLTFFVAATVFEGHRMTKKAGKIYPNKQSQVALEAPAAVKKPGARNGIVSRYCRLLKMWQTKVVVAVTILIYWYYSIQGCLTMEIRMDSTNLILKDSPLANTAYVYEKYLWRQGTLVFAFVNNPPDLSYPSNRQPMLDMVTRFETLDKSMGRNSTTFWLRSFLSKGLLDLDDQTAFYPNLEMWLQDYENGGGRWNEMVRLRKENGSVVGLDKFMFSTGSVMEQGTWNERAELQQEWRELADEYAAYNVTVFQSYSFYVDQLGSIGSTTVSTVLGALGTMAVACLCLIPSYTSIASSTMAMISINVGVFGLLSQWGVSLDPITMCTTLMAIGFSVDYTAHISYHYYRNPKEWPSDVRLADALRSIGWPMIQAGVSTLLSISPLIVIDSYMVSVFIKTTVLVIGLGLIHGILFLPMLLLSANPTTSSAKTPPQPAEAEPMPEKKFITIEEESSTLCQQKQVAERVLSQPLSIESQKEVLSATNSV